MVNILRAADFFEKKAKMDTPGKPGYMRRILQPNIKETLDLGSPQRPEEFGRSCIVETDCVNLHSYRKK